ncbi:MAG: hypothetical protein PQJ58_00825 [Spirochaetales bacterium]|nr:hypothetical protein [Spirochaetales bacterium]
MIKSRIYAGTILMTVVMVLSCNNPYAGIGEKLDSSSWIDINGDGGIPFIRSFDDGEAVELLIMEGEVLEGADFGTLSMIRVTNADLSEEFEPRQDIQILQGAYTITGSAIGFDLKKMYSLSFQSAGGSLITSSSQKEEDLDETLSFTGLTLDNGAAEKTITFTDGDGTDFTYKRMDLVIDALMADTDASVRAANIHKLYQITAVFAPQCRVPGFGGTDMLKYTTKTDFSSLMNTEAVEHYMSIQMRQTLKATTTFSFTEACDLKPFRVNGEYVSVANFYGSGPLTGVIDFTVQGSTEMWNCRLDYNELYVEYTVAASGEYLLSVDQGDWVPVPFDNTNPGVLNFSTIPDIPAN